MGAHELESMTWPEVKEELDRGRDTVVVCFGAVEQHGPHLPLGTDAFTGDAIGRAVADRLDAFLAPTVRIGCSRHHMGFTGTISLEEETFHRIVADVVRTLSSHGFRRLVLVPTHGGNFAPLGEAIERLGDVPGTEIRALTDIMDLMKATLELGVELGVPPEQGGIHAGEWETSIMLAIRGDLVRADEFEPGYTGELLPGMEKFLKEGAHAVSDNGVFGDPRGASAEAGERYVARLVDLVAASAAGES